VNELAVEVVHDYRRTTRQIVRDPQITFAQKCLALVDLVRAADHEDLSGWCRNVVWVESRSFLGCEHPKTYLPDDPTMRAARSLTARGYIACPACCRPLPTEVDLDRWNRLREYEVNLMLLREAACTA
jgi:hypothetical protein